MKRFLVLLVFVTGFTTSFAQKEKDEKDEKEEKNIAPPAAAKAAFVKKFAGATKAKWEKEKSGDYEVSFLQAKKEMSAVYDAKGNLKETEWEIKTTELPAAVTAYVKQHYKGAKISEAAKIQDASGAINFEARLKGVDIIFDGNGTFLKEIKD